ncbi:MAG: transporter substrate-binding domain-containing protein [Clostridia bacterium]|nr:transporter substrate-binding domain-containing protein [Clostridia bacterium]
MKKAMVIVLAMAMLMSVMLVGCGGKGESKAVEPPQWVVDFLGHEPTGKLAEIYEKGELHYVVSPDFAPSEFIVPGKTGDEQYAGSDIELAKHIAEKMGVKLKIEALDFDSCLTYMSEGLADIAITGLAATEKRREAMDFTDPYNLDTVSYQGLMIANKDKDIYTSYEAFKGKTVAVQNGSLQQQLAEKYLVPAGANIYPVTKTADAILMLDAGTVDACVMSSDNGDNYAMTYKNLGMIPKDVLYLPDTSNTSAAIPFGENEDYLLVLNKIINDQIAEGLYVQWQTEAEALCKELAIEF